MNRGEPRPIGGSVRSGFNAWDLLAFTLIVGAFVLVSHGARQTLVPLTVTEQAGISLDPAALPGYALRTTLRMFAAIAVSLVFTLVYATLAAKSRRAEMVLIPLLDVLQSVPILGFLSFTVVAFVSLFPGRTLGVECAAVFAIFTSQAWNMTFSLYQSLSIVPRDLEEVSRSLRLTGWQKFWWLELPFAVPGLVWNTMMSMSGGWFFVVASEAISVGDNTYKLPGIGSYLASAIEARNLAAVGWALAAMLVVILIYDQLLFRPLVAWAERFRSEQTAATGQPLSSPVGRLMRRAALLRRLLAPLAVAASRVARLRLLPRENPLPARRGKVSRAADVVWLCVILGAAADAAWRIVSFVGAELTWADALDVLRLGAITLVRVLVLIAVATLVWVPIGVWIGLSPRLTRLVQPVAQFLAAFPVNVVFPLVVVSIVGLKLDPDIWLSPLIIMGTQWYILFNVIAGASAFPGDLREIAASFRVRGWQWWRKVILPGIFPYYVTGAITASGGSWNASIVAEYVSWGDTKLAAHGIGAYIAQATDAGDYPRIVLGVAVMSVFVTLVNRLLWRPLYVYATRRLRLD
jgi:NitT/TauT family transport system permease protein